ncbi:MAG TPA: class I SAM-dependent methyltransferase [Verrucomicrobiales bacterium]|nr:class I SAM-dependent methyltransferase [Verrucomicrobiales bacterium]
MPAETRDWYDTPLQYDIIFDADTPREADFLEAMWVEHGPSGPPGRVLEPACGSGRLVLEMARRGWSAAGFDGNASMLEFARGRLAAAGMGALLWQDRMESFRVPGRARFDLAHCLVSTFKYLLTEDHAVSCLRRVASVLKPGGIFVLGLHLTEYGRATPDHERWVAERGGIHVTCNTRTWPADPRARLEAVRTRLRVRQGGREHLQETRWHFRTYSAAELHRLLRQVPELRLAACHDFTYDAAAPLRLDGSHLDAVLVLRRR